MFTNPKSLKVKKSIGNSSVVSSNSDRLIPSIISNSLKMSGNLNCDGIIEVQGEVEGNINCKHAHIRNTGVVKGDIVGEIINIEGCVEGMIKGKSVIISKTGIVNGIIIYDKISITEGGYIEAHCKKLSKVDIESIEMISNQSKESEDMKMIVENN